MALARFELNLTLARHVRRWWDGTSSEEECGPPRIVLRMGVYQREPQQAPDSDFVGGELAHLVVGNCGRMLDARRTPVAVTAIQEETGHFELEVLAFEDSGARWQIELEKVDRFQFARRSSLASATKVKRYREAVERFDRPMSVPVNEEARSQTSRRIAGAKAAAAEWLPLGLRLDLDSRRGDVELARAFLAFLATQGLAEIELQFAERFVSNPSSGETVKGHRIVLADLGLVAYHGKVVRDPALFVEQWSREERAAHICARLGFVRAMFEAARLDRVTLYRGLSSEGALKPHPQRSLVSASFHREVAESLFEGGPATTTSVLYRQVVLVERVFMTYLETSAMNGAYLEAEAILLAEGANLAF